MVYITFNFERKSIHAVSLLQLLMGICQQQCSFLWKGVDYCHKMLRLKCYCHKMLPQYELTCSAYKNNVIQVADER